MDDHSEAQSSRLLYLNAREKRDAPTPGNADLVEALEEEMPLRLSLVPLPRLGESGQTRPRPAAVLFELERSDSAIPDHTASQRAAVDDTRAGMAHPPGCSVTAVFWNAEHEPEKPSWDCIRCGKSWPCDPAREHMASYLGRVALAIHMWERLDEAAGDLCNLPPSELFERFLRWTR